MRIQRVDIINDFEGNGVTIEGVNSATLSLLVPLTDQTFVGAVSLQRYITHYLPYTVTSNIVLTKVANPIINGGAFVRMIANGTNTPVFSAFKKIAGSTFAIGNRVVLEDIGNGVDWRAGVRDDEFTSGSVTFGFDW